LTDIVRVKNEYYVRASSALADDRTRVLKYGDTFAVFYRYGDIEAFGPSQFGLFHAESRHLSRFTMCVNQQQPLLLSSTIREDNAFLSVDLANLDSPVNSDDPAPRNRPHFPLTISQRGKLLSAYSPAQLRPPACSRFILPSIRCGLRRYL
jgi:hypothetical protein